MGLRTIMSGSGFLLSIVSGIWLHRLGKPLNSLIFTVHKLLAVLSVVLAVILVRNLLKSVGANAIVLAFAIVAAISLVALFVTGALMSIEKTASNVQLTIHNIATILAIVSMAATILSAKFI